MIDRITRQKLLIATSGAHIIQDGLGALQYVLLPILAQAFGLSYTQVGLLRAASNTAMSILEIPAGILAEKYGEPVLISAGLVFAGLGYIGVALADKFYWIVIFFVLSGAGAAFQHSLSSSLIACNFDPAGRRKALGTYNSAGDAGKLAFTAIFGFGLGLGIAWNASVILLSLSALLLAAITPWLCRRAITGLTQTAACPEHWLTGSWGIKDRARFTRLTITASLDSVAQAVFFTFIAFLLIEKGMDENQAAIAIVMALSGGMVGKFCSGFLAAEFGDRRAFLLLQGLTIVSFILIVNIPAVYVFWILPLVGLVVQGSSTVTYGSVSEFVAEERQARGYALIYSVGSAASVAGTFAFGVIGDVYGLNSLFIGLSLLVVITLITGRVLKTSINE
ncbi:MAG: FSR family fosmidomycin resistance protein-like MFS transporter [Gammaproteobacteria bacterium]